MFKKYNSIENHYRQKYILNSMSQHPEIETCKYVAREKIDGANFQIYFKRGNSVKFGKRSSFLKEDDSFFNYQEAVKKIQHIVEKIDTMIQEDEIGHQELRLFGELFGPGINGRVDYGDSVNILFFDMEVDGKMANQQHLESFFSLFGFNDLLVPLIGYYDGISEALQASCDFDSKVLGKEGNASEGIVIKPYSREFIMGNGSRFLLKKKSDKFKEKETGMKQRKHKEDLPEDVVKLMLEFRSYINKNRVLSVFSKHGEIQEPCQLGKYIQLISEDAREDFLKDNVIPDSMDKKVQKKIFNVGGHIATLLREHL